MSLGIDVVDLHRFERTVRRTPGIRTRFFTPGELAYCEGSGDSLVHLAATLAAKEAVMKVRDLVPAAAWMKRIEIVRRTSGAPVAVVRAEQVPVSISHDGNVVVAVATEPCACSARLEPSPSK